MNTVLPGPTFSEGSGAFTKGLAVEKNKTIQEIEKEFFQTIRPTSILQQFIDPYEIASLVAYLSSDLSIATNGAAVRADGGVVKSAF